MQASDGDEEEEMVSSTLPGFMDYGYGIRGTYKESARIKDLVSAVYMETCDRELGNVSLPYTGHTQPLTDNLGC